MTRAGIKIAVDLHVHKVTDNPEHPYPWRWWVCLDTPYGNYTDEALCKDEEDCEADFERRFKQWLLDHKTARASASVKELTVDLSDLELPW